VKKQPAQPLNKRGLVCAIITAAVWGFAAGTLLHLQHRNAVLESAVNAYKHQFRQRMGEDKATGPYHHITLDGGLTWWQCTLLELPDDSVAVLVGGRANQELVDRLNKAGKTNRPTW